MKNEKVIAFAVMACMIVMCTFISVNIFLNNNKSIGASFLDENVEDNSKIGQLLNTDEKILSGEDSENSNEGVVSQLENIMTYEDELAFKVVKAKKGQTIMCSYGCSEFVLSSGSAKAIYNGEKGFIDITSGDECKNGGELLKNHLYILLVENSAGAGVTSDEAEFLIRGGHKIIE